MKKNEKTPQERIKALQTEIIANSKDAKWAKEQLAKLTALLKREAEVPVELIVPCSEVKKEVDFGAYRVVETIRGVLFQCKGGMSTFIESRMTAVHQMVSEVFLHSDFLQDEEMVRAYKDAVAYLLQAPIFGALDNRALFDISSAILKTFNDYTAEHYENAEAVPETEEDIKANDEFEKFNEAVETIADSAPDAPQTDE